MSSPKIKPQAIPLSEFLSAVPGEYRDFVSKIDEAMTGTAIRKKSRKRQAD